MSDSFFEQAAAQGKRVLLDFGAQWCGTCKGVDRLLEHDVLPSQSDRVLLVKVDVDERPDLAEKYAILSVPTLVLCTADQKVIWRKSGFVSRRELESALA
jgi:thioredoxin 1